MLSWRRGKKEVEEFGVRLEIAQPKSQSTAATWRCQKGTASALEKGRNSQQKGIAALLRQLQSKPRPAE